MTCNSCNRGLQFINNKNRTHHSVILCDVFFCLQNLNLIYTFATKLNFIRFFKFPSAKPASCVRGFYQNTVDGIFESQLRTYIKPVFLSQFFRNNYSAESIHLSHKKSPPKNKKCGNRSHRTKKRRLQLSPNKKLMIWKTPYTN